MKDLIEMSACIQGGYPRPISGYQIPNHQIGAHSPPMAWQYPPVLRTPAEDRNDSGINSASDSHSSSPGSEHGVVGSFSPTGHAAPTVPIYRPPNYPENADPCAYPRTSLAWGPEPTSPKISVKSEPEDYQDNDEDSTITGCISPDPNSSGALKCLEISMERTLSSTASPGMSENSMDGDKKSEPVPEDYDENIHRVPRINSHGKMKILKCKTCSFTTVTKENFWMHLRVHIKPEKLLTCHKCPFVTEYKHHLEYHLRNHDGSKPFKCDDCEYTCVNKSMLNSHMKSHSNVYQYRCANCHYASKYCHSLKLHLRKYGHQPAMVLNPDGSPNPLPIIDVYGTRRGPKVKPLHLEEEDQPKLKKPKSDNPAVPVLPLPLQQLMTQAPPMQMPIAYTWLQQAMIYQNLLARGALSPKIAESSGDHQSAMQTEVIDSSGALDLSKDSEAKNNDHSLKIDTPSTSSDEEEEHSTTVFENVEVVQNDAASEDGDKPKPKHRFEMCQYCDISFGDAVLYTMHMGYHGYKDPFACNMCGQECDDKISFFLHIARTPHI